MKKKFQTPTFLLLGIVLLGLLLFTGCAHNEVIDPCLQGKQYNFWWGLLHGFIAPFNFIASLFNEKYTLYAPNNTGNWYAFGFLLGSGGWGILGGRGTKRRNKKGGEATQDNTAES